MVNAILAGRKTQTRRVAKCDGNPFHSASGAWVAMNAAKGEITEMRCPYGEPGDSLWVRETWADVPLAEEDGGQGDKMHTVYRADGESAFDRMPAEWDFMGKWKPSIHMPRAASRITLKVTDIRLEGLNDISPEDAAAEGWPGPDEANTIRSSYPIAWYSHLWDKINGKQHPWESNPWVWVVCFTNAKGAEHGT
jgi:hypothetical protein